MSIRQINAAFFFIQYANLLICKIISTRYLTQLIIMDCNIDQRIQAAIQPLLKRISDLENQTKSMRKIMEEMNHMNQPSKTNKPSTSVIDKSGQDKIKAQQKPKPKEQVNKTVDKQKDNKKTGSPVQNNHSIIMNGKDKMKNNPQGAKDKNAKPVITKENENKQMSSAQAKIQEAPIHMQQSLPIQEKMNGQTQHMTDKIQSNPLIGQIGEQVKSSEPMMMQSSEAPTQSLPKVAQEKEFNQEITEHPEPTSQIVQNMSSMMESKIDEVENKVVEQQAPKINEQAHNVQQIKQEVTEQHKEQGMISESKAKEEHPNNQSQITPAINTQEKTEAQALEPETKAEVHAEPKVQVKAKGQVKPQATKNEKVVPSKGTKNPSKPEVTVKKPNQSIHDKNKSKVVPHKAEVMPKKQTEAKIQKKPAVNPKMKTETKEIKEVKEVKGVKGKEAKPISSKSHITSPQKGTAANEVKSEAKNSQLTEKDMAPLNAEGQSQKTEMTKMQKQSHEMGSEGMLSEEKMEMKA